MDGSGTSLMVPGSPSSPAPASPVSPSSVLMDIELPAFSPQLSTLWESIKAYSPLDTNNCLQRHGINKHMRARMVDWIVDVMLKLDSMPNSMFLAFKVMDVFLTNCRTTQTQHDLLPIGLISMFLASKYLDRYPIRLQNLYERIGFERVTIADLLSREQQVLRCINFSLTFPTPLDALEVLIAELGLDGVMAKSCEMLVLLIQLDPALAAIHPAKQATCAVFLVYMTYAKQALPCLLQLAGYAQAEIESECDAVYNFLMDFPRQGDMYQSAMVNLGFEIGEDDAHPLFKFLDLELEQEHRHLMQVNC